MNYNTSNRFSSSVYAGIFLVSCSVLSLEILLTRICSITIWYHFAFMVISIVLLGFGASGAYLSVSSSLARDDAHKRMLSDNSLFFSISTIVAYILLREIPLDPFKVWSEPIQLIYLFLYYLLLFVPFFFAGVIIGASFTMYPARISRIYFWDLLGAGVGCLLVAGLISPLGAPRVLIICATLPLAAFILFSLGSLKCWDYLKVGGSVFIFVFLFVISPTALRVPPCPSKGLAEMLALSKQGYAPRIVFSKWSLISRLDVTSISEHPAPMHIVGLSDRYKGYIPPQYGISIDGDAGTMLTAFDGDFSKLEALDHALYSVAYQLHDAPKVLAIGLGGGIDILTALKNGASRVDGAELNRVMVDIPGRYFADFTGNLYQHKLVDIHYCEGRSFIRRSKQQYDHIQLSGVDTWSGLASGAYTLSENYLYTVEAILDMLAHLKDDGTICYIRYMFRPPREVLRLCSLAIVAFECADMGHPRDNIAVIGEGTYASFILKKTPLTRREIDTLRSFADKNGFEKLYLPGRVGNNAFYGLLNSDDPQAFYEMYRYNIVPVYDDAPFFFKYYKWHDFRLSPSGVGGQDGASFPIGEIILIVLFIQAIFLSVLFILYPLYKNNKDGIRMPGSGFFLVYFTCLGVGFMFMEISLIQKLNLFLGHPIYSITVVLLSILVFTGVGSLLASRLQDKAKRNVTLVVIALVCLITLYVSLVFPLLDSLLGIPFFIRVAIALVITAPIGLLLGMPFPSGLLMVSQRKTKFTPWCWGINGCASVIGSIAAMFIAMTIGFTFLFMLSGAIYIIAAICMLKA